MADDTCIFDGAEAVTVPIEDEDRYAEIVIVPIEHEDRYADRVGDSDKAHVSRFRSARRRAEILAWRAAVRQKFGNVIIDYDTAGAPVVRGGTASVRPAAANAYEIDGVSILSAASRTNAAYDSGRGECRIGVTHTEKFAAVIFSDRRCAIDMESTARNFDHAVPRFVSPSEATLPESHHPLFRCAVWCAKEVLYKYSGRREIDLLRDIKITSTDIEGGKISGAILQPKATESMGCSNDPAGVNYSRDTGSAGNEENTRNADGAVKTDNITTAVNTVGEWQEHTLGLMPYDGGRYLIIYMVEG